MTLQSPPPPAALIAATLRVGPAPAAHVDWWEVVAVLRAVDPAAVITMDLAAGLPTPRTISAGWRVEPSWPVVITIHDNPIAGPAGYRARAARYLTALDRAHLRLAPLHDDLWPRVLVVIGRLPGPARKGGPP